MPNNIDSVLPQNLIGGIQTPHEIATRTYKLDLENGHVIGIVDGLQAVKQAAAMALLSVRFKTLIFSPEYASELDSIIGWNSQSSEELKKAQIDWAVRDALSTDSRITAVGAITTELVDDGAYITVEFSTIYGDTSVEAYHV